MKTPTLFEFCSKVYDYHVNGITNKEISKLMKQEFNMNLKKDDISASIRVFELGMLTDKTIWGDKPDRVVFRTPSEVVDGYSVEACTHVYEDGKCVKQFSFSRQNGKYENYYSNPIIYLDSEDQLSGAVKKHYKKERV